jgi:hypothetical protein
MLGVRSNTRSRGDRARQGDDIELTILRQLLNAMGLRYIPDAESAGCINASGAHSGGGRVLNLSACNIPR